MKILEKISIRRGLKRYVQPNFSYPKITRTHYYRTAPYKLTPSQQLHKYSAKPRYFTFRWILFIFAGGLSAVFWKIYESEMYTNELDTIYRYRFHEEEVPSAKLYSRHYFMSIFFWLEKNFWLSGFQSRQAMGTETLTYQTECLIRYEQYRHYAKNKDTKYDFLDIGVLQKFPYPKKPVEGGME